MTSPSSHPPSSPTARRRLLAIDSAPAQRRAGRVMLAVAAVGVLVAVVGTIVGWQLVGQIDATTSDTLEVSVESLDSLAETIELADDILGSTSASLDAVVSTLASVSASFDSATGVLDEFGTFADTAGPTLTDTTALVRQLEGIGTSIDEALGAVSRLPIGLDYDPAVGLGETLGSLADTLEPLATQLQSTADDLAVFTEDLDALRSDLDTLTTTVNAINAELDGTDLLVDQYRTNVAEAKALALATRDDVSGDAGWMRLLIVLGGLNFAIGQIVPLWFGRELLHRSRLQPDVVEITEPAAADPPSPSGVEPEERPEGVDRR